MNNYPDNCQDPNGNYPWNTPNEEQDCVEKDVEVCISLSKTVKILTDDYVELEEEEWDVDIDDDGNKCMVGGKFVVNDFSDTNWKEAYIKDECCITSLLKEYSIILNSDLESIKERIKDLKALLEEHPELKATKKQIAKLKNNYNEKLRKFNACINYNIDDLEVFEA